jgi:preprotein translocase subunit YajC
MSISQAETANIKIGSIIHTHSGIVGKVLEIKTEGTNILYQCEITERTLIGRQRTARKILTHKQIKFVV